MFDGILDKSLRDEKKLFLENQWLEWSNMVFVCIYSFIYLKTISQDFHLFLLGFHIIVCIISNSESVLSSA